MRAVVAPRIHAELGRQEPADAPVRQAPRHRSRHLEPVLLADPAGHRGRRAPGGLRRPARRHPARQGARGALRDDAEEEGSGRPDLLGHRLPKEAEALVSATADRCAPVVNGCEFSPQLGVPSVHIDNAKASHEAMGHLYDLGHRRIGVVTGPLVSPLSRDRLRGAMSRASQAGAKQDFSVLNGDFSIESGITAAEVFLKRPDRPTAIFCFNDEMAMGVIETARRLGVSVPRDLSVVGFDDIRFARYMDPPLTTIAQPMREIGEGCVRLLLEILRGDQIQPVSVTLPHTLFGRRRRM